MPTKKEQIEDINLRFHAGLFNYSLKGLQGMFLKDKTEISKSLMKQIVKDETGLTGFSLYDKKYYVTDWKTWEKIIDKFFIDTMIYKSDYLDCDNFAFLFTSMASLMGLNSSGVITGNVVDKDNNRQFRQAKSSRNRDYS